MAGGMKEGDSGIVPIVKKEEGMVVEEYRGIPLMPTLYKIYASALAERLREEVERKAVIPHNHTSFRKGIGTIDNIYILNYIVNRQLAKKGGMVVTSFIETAFDTMDREALEEALRGRGIREGLMKRIEKMIRETKHRVRVGESTGEVSRRQEG